MNEVWFYYNIIGWLMSKGGGVNSLVLFTIFFTKLLWYAD